MQLGGVLETAIYVDDLAVAEAFYRDVMKLELERSDPPRHVFFRCGEAMFLLFDPESTTTGRVVVNGVELPHHGVRGAGHVAFRVEERELASWKAWLDEQGVAIEAEIDWPNGGRSVYFRDPSGNSLELATPRLWGLPEL